MSSNKRKEPRTREIGDGEGEDIISSFPESLLIYILSFLKDTKETVKTCVLSKRWQFVWTHLLEIHLQESSFDDIKQGRFVNFVGKMIDKCRSLNKLAIVFVYKECFASNVNEWLDFAIKNKVKDITLEFYGNTVRYNLPQMLFSYSSLSKLSVRNCVMDPPLGIIEWKSLESLTLERVDLLDTVMENILSNCPRLNTLKLYFCLGLVNLNIKSPNLTTLVYVGHDYCYVPDISATYLRILCINSRNGRGRKFQLKNVSSVVQATIELSNLDFTAISTMNHMKHLLESLQSVEILVLGPHCLQIVWLLEVESWKIPSYTKLWSLTLKVYNSKMSIPGILAILRSAPNLNTLVIKQQQERIDYEKKIDFDQCEICVKDCNINNLKTVEIDFYHVTEEMLTLVRSLLKCANVLEKMVIRVKNNDPHHINSTEIMEEIAKWLLTFPKASPEAVVVLQ